MKTRINSRTVHRLERAHVDAFEAMETIGRIAEDVRLALGVKHDDENAKDHIMDFCGGTVTPKDLLNRLGIKAAGDK